MPKLLSNDYLSRIEDSSLLSDFSDHREWPISFQPSVWTVHGLLESKITSTLLLVLKQDVTLIWSFCNKLSVQCQVPCILLIIQDLNVTLKSVAYLMSPSKRCVVNVKLDGSMKYPCLFAQHPFVGSAWICWCGYAPRWLPVLLKLLYVAVKAIYWKWRNRLSQLHNEFDWVLQYYSRLQHVKL